MTTKPEAAIAPSPFAEDADGDATDRDLVARVVAGDRTAVEALVGRHQRWIYNLAFRMVMVRHDAEDVTQEILIKVLTKLSTFDPGKGTFRGWLYRVVANHVINMRKRGYEVAIGDVETYYSFVKDFADEDPDTSPETQRVIADVAIGCVMGVFLCLERDQRLAFILAVAFNASDAQGADVLGTNPASFRKLLSRARGRLHEYMNGNCGLVNPAAPCHCRKKVMGFMRRGGYGPDRLTFVDAGEPSLESVVGKKLQVFNDEIYADYARLLRAHPFYRGPEQTAWLRTLVERPEFKEVFS